MLSYEISIVHKRLAIYERLYEAVVATWVKMIELNRRLVAQETEQIGIVGAKLPSVDGCR